MAEIFTESSVRRTLPQCGVTKIYVDTGTTNGDVGNTIAINLGSYGMSEFKGISEWIHTTDGSIVVPAASSSNGAYVNYWHSTTAVSGGVLTITIGTGTDLRHVYEITGI